jgi:hypothetical protein
MYLKLLSTYLSHSPVPLTCPTSGLVEGHAYALLDVRQTASGLRMVQVRVCVRAPVKG